MNRDISWLSFNYRVLEEARDKHLPVYERLKFLAIYSSNLDEFYKVRVASYRRILNPDSSLVLSEILRIVDHQQQEFGKVFWKELVPELKKDNIILKQNSRLSGLHREFVDRYFHEELIPCLQAIVLLRDKISPFLKDGFIYLAVKMFKRSKQADTVKNKKARYALVNIPTDQLPRFIELPAVKERHSIIFLDGRIQITSYI